MCALQQNVIYGWVRHTQVKTERDSTNCSGKTRGHVYISFCCVCSSCQSALFFFCCLPPPRFTLHSRDARF